MTNDSANRGQGLYFLLCGAVLAIGAGLVLYSQTAAFAWDEGFHLLAAQLIKAGKRPYLDFVFSQTPLNAYWNAAWMRVFGESWRTAHAVAAVCTTAAVMLIADFVFTHFPVPRWRFAAALAAACAMGMNVLIVDFGTIGQAYGLCLLLITAAFRTSIVAAQRRSSAPAALAGLLAGAAASSSLLTAPVAPVLLLWILIYSRAGLRWAKGAAFAAGGVLAFLPLIRLLIESPRQVYFGVIEYNFRYRGVQWERATVHNIEVWLSWVDSSHALALGLLAITGLVYIHFYSGWQAAKRAEFYLCAWLALALCIHISTAHPTFERYYLLAVPFLAVLAVAGLYRVTITVFHTERPYAAVLLLTILLAFGLGKSIYEEWDDWRWSQMEEIARKVDQVTPRDGILLADEHIYFLTGRRPPSGMELVDSHKLQFDAARAAFLHVVSFAEIKRRVSAGAFQTVQVCEDGMNVGDLDMAKLYVHQAEVEDCTVYWEKAKR
ncbi:MAG: hypothetical protein ABJF23_28650 [Bryobacteraceae bacterium]